MRVWDYVKAGPQVNSLFEPLALKSATIVSLPAGFHTDRLGERSSYVINVIEKGL